MFIVLGGIAAYVIVCMGAAAFFGGKPWPSVEEIEVLVGHDKQ